MSSQRDLMQKGISRFVKVETPVEKMREGQLRKLKEKLTKAKTNTMREFYRNEIRRTGG